MEQNLKRGQIFWLIIPFLNKRQTYARPFLVYKIEDKDYVFLKISSTLKDYIPQFEIIDKPSSLYKKRNFVDPNILIFVKHDLFYRMFDETLGLKGQGQQISSSNFQEITKKVEECFGDDKFLGNRYEIRVR